MHKFKSAKPVYECCYATCLTFALTLLMTTNCFVTSTLLSHKTLEDNLDVVNDDQFGPVDQYHLSSKLDSQQQQQRLASALLGASSLTAPQASGQVSSDCEPIQNPMCSHMAYKSTRMPNFYQDSNQILASERALILQELVNTRCNPHIQIYVCELLFPVCLEDKEAMKRFDIYPCRSFCRRLQQDCGHEIKRLVDRLGLASREMIKNTFGCSLLPFEANGRGNELEQQQNRNFQDSSSPGDPRQMEELVNGPCHEISEITSTPNKDDHNNRTTTTTSQGKLDSMYQPFKPDQPQVPPLDQDQPFYENVMNVLSPNPNSQMINQQNDNHNINNHHNNSNNRPNNNQHIKQQQSWYGDLNQMLQTSLRFVAKYSELLTVLLIVCLVLVLTSGRLYKLRDYLKLRSSHSSSSSNNSSQSSSYRNQLKNHHLNQSKQLISNGFGSSIVVPNHNHNNGLSYKTPISPSSSSRSLVLIAASNGATSHQLLKHQQQHQHENLISNGLPIDAPENLHSKNLIQGLASQKTLINLNSTPSTNPKTTTTHQTICGTLDGSSVRSNARQQAYNRELIMDKLRNNNNIHTTDGSLDRKHLFNTLDSNHSSCGGGGGSSSAANHYDVVYSNDDQLDKWRSLNSNLQEQMFSNIILSSPSHQVLLIDPPTINPSQSSSMNMATNGAENFHLNQRQTYRGISDLSHHQIRQNQQQFNNNVNQQHAVAFQANQYATPEGGTRASNTNQAPYSHQRSSGIQRHHHQQTRSSKRRCGGGAQASLSSGGSSMGVDSDSMMSNPLAGTNSSGFGSSSTPISSQSVRRAN